jgi:hypothetical protein
MHNFKVRTIYILWFAVFPVAFDVISFITCIVSMRKAHKVTLFCKISKVQKSGTEPKTAVKTANSQYNN